MTRTEKWANKRAEIQKESEEIKNIIKAEDTTIFDELMGHPLQMLEELCDEIDRC